MASALKIPELTLTPDESKRLADAINEVNKHYDISVDPKVMAWVALGTTMTSIYAPRIGAYKIKQMAESKKKKEKLPEQVQVQEGLQPEIEPLPMSHGVPA